MDAIRDSDSRQTIPNGCQWPMHAGQAAYPVKLMGLGPSRRSYPDDCRWPVDAVPVALRVTPTDLVLRSQLYLNATSGNLACQLGDPPPKDCFLEDAVRNA